MAQASDYTALITSQHADAPKFVAMVGVVAQCFANLQNLLATIPGLYDLDAAVGAQLDAVGLWVGVSRQLSVPVSGVYFSLDTAGVGFDQGNWQGPYDPTAGLASLDDGTYRLLLRAKIGANHWDGTLGVSAAILSQIFAGTSTYAFVQDNGNMSITLGVSGQIPSALFLALLATGSVAIRPEGVLLSSTFVTSSTSTPLFGFDVENGYVSGFDVGAWGTPH